MYSLGCYANKVLHVLTYFLFEFLFYLNLVNATHGLSYNLSIHLQIPGVPVIFGLRNALFLEPPSAFQRQFVKTSEEDRLHMTELDHKMLQKRARNSSADDEANDSSGENKDFVDQNIGIQTVRQPPTARKGVDLKDKVQFKRKKAKVVICIHILLYPVFFFLDWFLQALILAVLYPYPLNLFVHLKLNLKC